MSTGWMVTKKVGRDDKAIAAAKNKAQDERRVKRGQKPKKKPAARPAPKKTRRQELLDSDEESFDDEQWDESEEEEEDVILTEEDSSDDDNGGSFLQKSSRKNPRAKPMLKEAAKMKAKNKKDGFTSGRRRGKVTSSSSSDSDDDSDDDSRNPFSRQPARPTAASRKKGANKTVELLDDSDASEPKNGIASKYFAAKSISKNSFLEEDDTPVKPPLKKPAAKKRTIDLMDTDEDEDVGHKKNPRRSIGDASWNPDADEGNSSMDEDLAMVAALEASMKTQEKEKKKQGKLKRLGGKKIAAKRPKINRDQDDAFLDSDDEEMVVEEEKAAVYLDDPSSSSDDDEGSDNDQDVYMDEDEREASQVLAAANELSGSVMRIMTSWASDLNDGDETANANDDKVAIPQGMIVDGAIAMTSMKKNPSNNTSQTTWISNEVMKQVLPNVTLAEYQLLGVNWLAMLHSMTYKVTHGKNGKATNVNGILADEMGLGKTCQTIAFLAWLKHSRSQGAIQEIGEDVVKKGDDMSDDDESAGEGGDVDEAEDEDGEEKGGGDKKGDGEAEVIVVDTPAKETAHAGVSMREDNSQDSLLHLIVVPASVVSNWEREFQNFAPHMSIIKFHGTQEERKEMKEQLRAYLPKSRKKNAPRIDVIIAPITYFQKESSEDRDFLRRFQFDYLICDEGHLLKNAKGLRYKNIDKFKTRHRLLLTGTPIQNSPQELMALLCFLMPLFKSKRKSNDFDDNDADVGGESMLQHFVSLESANSQETSHEVAYRKLKQLFAPFVLRRKKKDVLSQVIPPKTYETIFVELGSKARQQYTSIVDAHVKAKRNKMKSTDHLFTSLRKAAHHPQMLRTRHNSPTQMAHLSKYFHQYGAFRGEGVTVERVAKELEGVSDFELHLTALELCDEFPLRRKELEPYILTGEDLFASAKLTKLQEMLPKLINEGHRILIFSVWTTCLDLLGCMLEHMGLKFMRMDGQTAVSDRQERIDHFNSDESIPIFLLSTNACGMGINLTSADTCIMHDISVNPFNDLQAEDRCHRIGQKKPVKVYKLVSNNTVDSDIYDMQERKVKMNAAIMEAPGSWSKQEKKEKALIMKNIVERHSEAKPTNAGGVSDKENVVNLADESDEADI